MPPTNSLSYYQQTILRCGKLHSPDWLIAREWSAKFQKDTSITLSLLALTIQFMYFLYLRSQKHQKTAVDEYLPDLCLHRFKDKEINMFNYLSCLSDRYKQSPFKTVQGTKQISVEHQQWIDASDCGKKSHNMGSCNSKVSDSEVPTTLRHSRSMPDLSDSVVIVDSTHRYDEEMVAVMKKELLEEPQVFLLNNLLLSVMFFEHYDK